MPTEEELEQRVTLMIDTQAAEHARAVIHNMEVERLNEIFSKGGEQT